MSVFSVAWPVLDVGWWFSTIGLITCMSGVQYILLKTYRARKVLPPDLVPTQTELYVGVAAFWLAYLGSVKTIIHVIRALVWVILQLEFLSFPGSFGNTGFPTSLKEALSGQHSLDTKIGFRLFNHVVLTWQIHHIILLTIDSAIPFVKNFQRNPNATVKTLSYRIHLLKSFLELITTGDPNNASPGPFKLYISDEQSSELSITQKIRLQRTRSTSTKKGRTLSWNLTVDKEAIDEMKETLGPPGGFGELGFCITKDEVKFEAMGVGTNFGLVFGVEEKDDTVIRPKLSIRPEVRARRRKTK